MGAAGVGWAAAGRVWQCGRPSCHLLTHRLLDSQAADSPPLPYEQEELWEIATSPTRLQKAAECLQRELPGGTRARTHGTKDYS